MALYYETESKVMKKMFLLVPKISVIPVELPTPTTSKPSKAVNQADEDKIGTVLQKD